jgi:hypothetical protein
MLILFGVEDSNNYYWWNIDGWNNTQEIIGNVIRCYLDGSSENSIVLRSC